MEQCGNVCVGGIVSRFCAGVRFCCGSGRDGYAMGVCRYSSRGVGVGIDGKDVASIKTRQERRRLGGRNWAFFGFLGSKR